MSALGESAKSSAKRVLAGAGWTALRALGRRPDDPRIAVIIYHSAGGGARLSFDPTQLDAHFHAIRRRFSRIATIGELAALPAAGAGTWTAAITFDDGFADNYDFVLPLLERHRLKATFFICTGFVDGLCDIGGRRKSYAGLKPMRWDQVRRLAAAGMEIGAHTVSHPLLARLCAREQEGEMVASKERLEDQIGRPVASFAIPYGNRGTYTPETLALAARHFRACCTTRFSTNPAEPRRRNGMVVLDRVGPAPGDPPERLIEQSTGRWDAMRFMQRGRTTA
jgi:peptidoglycan/xylan/chitin deacetylase (PgdA/CDA1 family)